MPLSFEVISIPKKSDSADGFKRVSSMVFKLKDIYRHTVFYVDNDNLLPKIR